METKTAASFWWKKDSVGQEVNNKFEEGEITGSLAEFLEKEHDLEYLEELNDDEEVDIDSILEEITRLSAKSPLVPYERESGDRSIDDIMREAEKIYFESSKSFEQLSHRSKTSLNISEIVCSDKSDISTPTPKSISPLPLDDDVGDIVIHKPPDSDAHYSDDFSDHSELHSDRSDTYKPPDKGKDKNENEIVNNNTIDIDVIIETGVPDSKSSTSSDAPQINEVFHVDVHRDQNANENSEIVLQFKEEIVKKDEVIKMLIVDNQGLKEEIKSLEVQVEEMRQLLERTNAELKAQALKSPEVNFELEIALEKLKDTKEINTALQVQLDTANKSHQALKQNYEELLTANKQLERRMLDVDNALSKYKVELQNSQQQKYKIRESESSINRLLELERNQVKNLKQQIEKDSKCIMDLNRQIKEMERIIARKHPDSVSALIVAAKNENTPTTRKVLEERIKNLEQEAMRRDAQNSQVFIDVQEKFGQMKLKYESHIEDLELHVNDLKSQLKRRVDTYDVYTQTIREDQKIPGKETTNAAIQTEQALKPVKTKTVLKKPPERDVKEETHLLATIRGFQADLSNREKVIVKLQKEIDELRKTNRRLQKEREGSLKNLSENKYRSYPEKLSQAVEEKTFDPGTLEEELRVIKAERDKMKFQLCRIEEDYQALKAKRLQDLNTLQEAHEREMSTYLTNITPLREQLEVQQVSLTALQQQLVAAKEELAVVTVEKDHLNNKLNCGIGSLPDNFNGNDDEVVTLRKKVAHMEMKYEERENRLRAIVHGLAQKSVTNRSCEQCAARQQQLIGYKAELDQIIATLRCLQ